MVSIRFGSICEPYPKRFGTFFSCRISGSHRSLSWPASTPFPFRMSPPLFSTPWLRAVAIKGPLAHLQPFPYTPLSNILNKHANLLLILDGILDPRNLGSLLRTAEGSGGRRGGASPPGGLLVFLPLSKKPRQEQPRICRFAKSATSPGRWTVSEQPGTGWLGWPPTHPRPCTSWGRSEISRSCWEMKKKGCGLWSGIVVIVWLHFPCKGRSAP